MKQQLKCLASFALAISCASTALANEPPALPDSRTFQFKYNVEVEAPPAGEGPVDVFVPLAKSDEHQDVVSRNVEASIKGEVKKDAEYGNEFWHGHMDKSDGKPVTVAVSYTVKRKKFSREALAANKEKTYTKEELAPQQVEP